MSERQEFIEGTDAVVECPVFLGDPPGSMIWSRDNMAINDGRFILEDGRLTIQDIRAGDGDVYQCSCLLYTSPSPRDATLSRMPSSA